MDPLEQVGGWVPSGFKPKQIDGNWQFRGRLSTADADSNIVREISPELILRAAFVPRPMHISGWDMTSENDKGRMGAPKPTARLVAPGAVYFFELVDPAAIFSSAELWLAAIGARTAEGFGRVVPGIWKP